MKPYVTLASLLLMLAPGCSDGALESEADAQGGSGGQTQPAEDPPARPDSTSPKGEAETIDFACDDRQPAPERPTVMIIDTGFDLNHPVFDGKIAGCYHLTCSDTDPLPPASTEDELAAQLVSTWSAGDERCHLEEGSSLTVESYLLNFSPEARDDWNRAHLKKEFLPETWSYNDAENMYAVLAQGSNGKFLYHGTGTASLIAYENDVNLVMVQINLGTHEDAAAEVECVDPDELAMEMAVLERPEVRDAYIKAPLSSEERELLDLERAYGVRVRNESFGPIATHDWEEMLTDKGCPTVELGDYTRAYGELDAERDAYRRATGVFDGVESLRIQAAGNEGLDIEGPQDKAHCTPNRVDRLLVGSYGLFRGRGALSWFSNRGGCVDLYALGEDVIHAAPASFVSAGSGTSYASPLVARVASQWAKEEPTMQALRDRVVAARTEDRFLPEVLMPVELAFFDPRTSDGMVRTLRSTIRPPGPPLYDLRRLPRLAHRR